MDRISSGFLTFVAGKILNQIILELPGRLRRLIEGDPAGKETLQEALAAGLAAALGILGSESMPELLRYGRLLEGFLSDPEVTAAIARLVDLPYDVAEADLVDDLTGLDARLRTALGSESGDVIPVATARAALMAFVEGYGEVVRQHHDKLQWINVTYLDAQLKSVRAILQRLDTPDAVTREHALRSYLIWLRERTDAFPMPTLDVRSLDGSSGVRRAKLANLFVDLGVYPIDTGDPGQFETEIPREEDRSQRALVDLLCSRRHVLLFGGPGSGKSTVVRHLANTLAIDLIEPLTTPPGPRSRWPQAVLPVPLIVRVRDVALDFVSGTTDRGSEVLLRPTLERMKAEGLGEAVDALREQMEYGDVLVLVDGLDEVGSRADQQAVLEATGMLRDRFPACYILATCRTTSFVDALSWLPGFSAAELAPLSDEQIRHFIDGWYAELGRLHVVRPERTRELAAQLLASVGEPRLRALAASPVLLVVLASLAASLGHLPTERAPLYEAVTDTLLIGRDEMSDTTGAPSLRNLLRVADRTESDLRRVLWELAYDMHGRDASSSMDAERIVLVLRQLHPSGGRTWALDVVKWLHERSGLLVEIEPDVFEFAHKSIQEYFAGAHLGAQNDFAQQAAALAEDSRWRSVILAGVGRLVHVAGDVAKPLALVAQLSADNQSDSYSWRRAWLAGDVLLEIGINRVEDSEWGARLLHDVVKLLDYVLKTERLTKPQRTGILATAARLGKHQAALT